jgi:hypothetical protein
VSLDFLDPETAQVSLMDPGMAVEDVPWHQW